MNEIIFSCVIPVSKADSKSQHLKDLIASIKSQDFPQDQIEILVMGEEYGDSEQAKAAGIRQASGKICAMFCADNYITKNDLFKYVMDLFNNYNLNSFFGSYYDYIKKDNSLNRYFSLIGNNDPIAFYLKKSDRLPYFEDYPNAYPFWPGEKLPSLGDNGYFVRRESILKTNLDHYYPMDNAVDMFNNGDYGIYVTKYNYLWHRTSDNLIKFLIKRYRYARDLYCDRKDRRWKMLNTREDYLRLLGFAACTITILPCLFISIRGFSKIRDCAWFWHWPVCFGFLIPYTILAVRNLFKHGNFFQIRCLQPVS